MKKALPFLGYAMLILIISISCQIPAIGGSTSDIEPTSTASYGIAPLPTATQVEANADQATAASDARSLILAALKSTTQKYPRTFNGQVKLPNSDTSSQMTVQEEAPDKRFVEVINPDGSIFSTVVISPTVYVNQGNGWETYTGDTVSSAMAIYANLSNPEADLGDFGEDVMPAISDNEEVNGIETVLYTYETTLPTGVMTSGKIWIGARDQLIYKYSVEASDGTQIAGTYDFTTPVSIVPPAEAGSTGVGLPEGNLCSLLPKEVLTQIIGREPATAPTAFDDDTQGKGCTYDFTTDIGETLVVTYSVAPISSFDDLKDYGSQVASQLLLGLDAFTIAEADGEQLWVKLNDSKALLIAINGQPNQDLALQMAIVLIPLVQMMP